VDELDESRPKIRKLTEERDRLIKASSGLSLEYGKLEHENRELREALERIEGMAGRPKCLCGRPTGTPAIRQCARAALEADGLTPIAERDDEPHPLASEGWEGLEPGYE
jgi:hypothetical protein